MLNEYTLKLIRQDGSFEIKQVQRENYCSTRNLTNFTRQVLRWLVLSSHKMRSVSDFTEQYNNSAYCALAYELTHTPSNNSDAYTALHILKRGVFKVADKEIIANSLQRYLTRNRLFEISGAAICSLCRDAIDIIRNISSEFSYFIFEYSTDADEFSSLDIVPLTCYSIFDASLITRDFKSIRIDSVSQDDIEKLKHMIKNGELSGSITILNQDDNKSDNLHSTECLVKTEQDPRSGVKALIKEFNGVDSIELEDILGNREIDFLPIPQVIRGYGVLDSVYTSLALLFELNKADELSKADD